MKMSIKSKDTLLFLNTKLNININPTIFYDPLPKININPTQKHIFTSTDAPTFKKTVVNQSPTLIKTTTFQFLLKKPTYTKEILSTPYTQPNKQIPKHVYNF